MVRVVSVFRVPIWAGLLLAVSSVSFGNAYAASGICATLKKQLVAVSNSSEGSQKYNRGAQQQALQLQQMRAKASKQGCGGFLFSRGDPALCKRYAQTIDKMSARLAKLQNASDRSRGPSRQQILASMSANGCNGGAITARSNDQPSSTGRKTLFEVLFGPSSGRNSGPSANELAKRQIDERAAQRKNRLTNAPETLATSYEGTDPAGNVIVKKGGYRTLCVRTCDGYYFPISFSSQPRNFARDQNACTAMCPSGNAQLYYHAVPEQESDDMISVADKKPYSELPNAFNYRTSGLRSVPGCSCHAAQGSVPIVSEQSTSDPQSQSSSIMAVSKEDTDPGVVAAVPMEDPAQGDIDETETEPQDVRMVGPAFFPVETKATDFRSPPPEKEVKESSAGLLTPENIGKTIASDIMKRIQ